MSGGGGGRPRSTAPALGELFAGRYELEALVGRGGMGSVYRVYDRELDERVALKLLDASSNTTVERFRREVRLARRVTHRNVARTYDLGEHGGLRFLTMELVDGPNLRDWMLERRPCPARALDVAMQIAAGLGTAHGAGVIHRDLKPSNVLLERRISGQEQRRVVITDFGVARMSAEQTLGAGGATLGTPAYMAPEQVAGEDTSPATDLYALGLIVFQMLAGVLPFKGGNAIALAVARLATGAVDLGAHPAIPVGLHPFFARCLARDPQARYAGAEDLLEALADLRGEFSEPVDLGMDSELGLASSIDGDADTASRGLPAPRTASSGSGATSAAAKPLFRTGSSYGLSRTGKALAVLPFRYRGPGDSAYLVDAMLEELTDLLSMTRGLEVSSAGATRQLTDAGDRDPRKLGRELGVGLIVDGTVQLAGSLDDVSPSESTSCGVRGPRLRVSARVLDVKEGFQLWSERFDGEFADVFEIQDKLCKRIAEALRVELELIGDDVPDDVEAIENYMRARQAKLLWRLRGPEGAIALYKRTLERAPRFKAALSGLAFASLRGWFLPEGRMDLDYDWPGECERAVAQAMEWAPELAETQVAAAALSIQNADLRGGALHLREALRIAPTCALAHEYFGRLLVEGPQPSRGVAHLEQALQLDPELEWCYGDLARYKALRGDMKGYQRLVDRLMGAASRYLMPTQLMEIRVGAWIGDEERITRARARLDAESFDYGERITHAFAGSLLMDYSREQVVALHERTFTGTTNVRARTYFTQLTAEQFAYHGDLAMALRYLERAADLLLTDALWLDRCPLFAGLQDDARFAALRVKVRRRADALLAI